MDSGQSVGESVFLDKVRQWLHGSLTERIREFKVPCVWTVYPNGRHSKRHGAYRVNEYDKWEVRPVRWRNRPLDRNGLLATVAMFEEGCHRLKIKAPWREFNSKRRRAAVVYLNPQRRCLDWGQRNWQKFKKHYNIPDLILGPPWRHSMPLEAHAWIDGCWGFDMECAERMKKAFWPRFGYALPWFKLWDGERPEGVFSGDFGVAHNWEDWGAIRYPQMAAKWANDVGGTVKPVGDEGMWQHLISQTGCQYYILATTRESVPFDAMIALARGTTLVAPDVPLFKNLPGKKILYPAHVRGDRIVWAQSQARAFVESRLKTWRQPHHGQK